MPEPIRAASLAEIRLSCLHLAYRPGSDEKDSLERCEKLFQWVTQDSGQSPEAATPRRGRPPKSESQT